MSWIRKLSETYDNCQSMIGYSVDESKRPLLPICHMTAQAHMTIVIDTEGKFQRAHIITERNDATTIIPCTEGSGSRAGKKPECHPLCDQLQYVAGDFVRFGGIVTSGFDADPSEPFQNYVAQLTNWCESECAHPKARAILKYVKKETVVKDLSEQQKLFVEKGKLIAKNDRKRDKSGPDIFDVVGSQDKVFVRWEVQTPDEPESKVWKDKTLWDSWIQYYFSTKKKEPLCYATGENAVLSTQHPKYIRAKGDGAKLVSSNDTSGFTFRGRFLKAEQACTVSLDVSQKAHSALQWLIDKQGKVFRVKGDRGKIEPGLTIVAWATSEKVIPQPTQDAFDILLGLNELPSDQPSSVSTTQELAIRLRNKILGYNTQLGETKGVQVMALDSASKGRLAIIYYQELKGSDYLARIDKWHQECAWIHSYRYKDIQNEELNNNQRKYPAFVGAPAPYDIAEASYGKKAADKLKKATVERILPCIIDGQQIPRDLVESAVRRASNRIAMEESEWNKTLSIACALFRKQHIKEEYSMALDPKRKKRDYLYGRLLAIADRLEEVALYKAKEKRATNAARYMQQFAEHPSKTWRQIYLSLPPYMARLGGAKYYKNLMDEVKILFDPIEDYNSDKPLTGEFLLAYHCQRDELKYRPDKNKKTDIAELDDVSEVE